MSEIVADAAFAPLDRDGGLERIAGGNETEVYRSDDGRFVVKLKSDLGGAAAEALAEARTMRHAAEAYATCLGTDHALPNHFVIARDSAGRAQVLVLQPFLRNAQPLVAVDYDALSPEDRERVAHGLRQIVGRALRFYREAGSMPDLYGRSSTSKEERRRANSLGMLPRRLWSFLVKRNLLRARNLMLTADQPPRIVLVDYDAVRRGRLYRAVYYGVRWVLFLRDLLLIEVMRRGGSVPGGE